MSRWIAACAVGDVESEDVVGVVVDGRSVAVYRSADDRWYATDGLCTHERVALADGFVMGHVVECPKHNGRFDYRTGAGLGAPICEDLKTYPVRVEGGTVHVDVDAEA